MASARVAIGSPFTGVGGAAQPRQGQAPGLAPVVWRCPAVAAAGTSGQVACGWARGILDLRVSPRGRDPATGGAESNVVQEVGDLEIQARSGLGVEGKRALVTGASSGIGFAISRELVMGGCAVAIGARGEDRLRTAQAELAHLGGRVFAKPVDVLNEASLNEFVTSATRSLGGLDYVVANAGGAVGGGLMEATPDEWAESYRLNVIHSVELLRAAVPFLKESVCPSAVFISSISGSKPAPRAQYGSSKAALIYLAAALARELAEHGIRVNCVSPGSILFPGGGWDGFRSREPERFGEFIERDLPGGRLGRAEEVARVVTFVLSPAASWINGANIPVDGAQGRPSAGGW